MKKLIGFSTIFALTLNSAFALSLKVNVRNEKNEIKTISVDQEMVSPTHYAETENFRVFKSVQSEVIDFTSENYSEDDLLRASTALYHAKLARQYFVETLNAPKAVNQPLINIRIEMNHPFNEFYHFVPESKLLEYNNAVTVPASNNRAMSDVQKWDPEMWFRSGKNEDIDNGVYQVAKTLDQMDLTTQMVQTVSDQKLQDSIIDSVVNESIKNVDYMGFVESILLTVGAFKVAPKFLMFATGKIKTKTYLDTAMIPEVVYHEYTHYAISDFIGLKRSTPVNEGIANYFAAVISNNGNIAAKTGKFSKAMGGYDGTSKMMYTSQMETQNSAHANFVFSFLWRLRLRMTKEFKNGDKLTDQLIFNSRQYVSFAKKPIKDDLLPAITKSVDDIFLKKDARRARMIITEVATQKGL